MQSQTSQLKGQLIFHNTLNSPSKNAGEFFGQILVFKYGRDTQPGTHLSLKTKFRYRSLKMYDGLMD